MQIIKNETHWVGRAGLPSKMETDDPLWWLKEEVYSETEGTMF